MYYDELMVYHRIGVTKIDINQDMKIKNLWKDLEGIKADAAKEKENITKRTEKNLFHIPGIYGYGVWLTPKVRHKTLFAVPAHCFGYRRPLLQFLHKICRAPAFQIPFPGFYKKRDVYENISM